MLRKMTVAVVTLIAIAGLGAIGCRIVNKDADIFKSLDGYYDQAVQPTSR